MILSMVNSKRFVFYCDFDEKEIASSAGFLWDPEEKHWYTDNAHIACKLDKYADTEALYYISSLSDVYKKEMQESWASELPDNHPLKNKLARPEGLNYLPYQEAGIAYALKRKGVLIADEPGLGKAQPINTKILTPSGWTTMIQLKVGDFVIGSNGKPTKVKGIFPQGKKETFLLKVSDGGQVLSCEDHLWTVENLKGEQKIIDTKQLSLDLMKGETYYLPKLKPVEFEKKNNLIPAYVIGSLLGKGSTRQRAIISVPNNENGALRELLIQKMLPESMAPKRWESDPERLIFYASEFTEELRKLNLMELKANQRFIPKQYLYSNISDRRELLMGLLDSGGSVKGSTKLLFMTSSTQMAKDVIELVRGLGGFARMNLQTKTTWRVSIDIDMPRYFIDDERNNKYRRVNSLHYRRKIESIAPDKKLECMCIRVDAKDHLYVTEDYILTHNTIQAIGWLNNHMDINPGDKVLLVCPATLKINWYRENLKWLVKDFTVGIVGSAKKDKEGNAVDNGWPDTDIIICNYDRLRLFEHELAMTNWKAAILDEAHMIKGDKDSVERSRMIYDFVHPKYKMMLTGTPIVNYPIEIFHMIRWLNEDVFPSYYSFAAKYCLRKPGKYGIDLKTGKNLEELQEKLRLNLMVRRLKMDVLKDLPPKMRQVIEIPADDARLAIKAEEKFVKENADILNEFYKIIANAPKNATQDDYAAAISALEEAHPIKFNELAKLRQSTAEKKVKLVVQYAKELIIGDPTKKVVIFAHHKSVIEGIMKGLGNKAVKIDGSMSVNKRQESIDSFQNDPKIRYCVLSMAGGVGVTLTAADHILFAELDWVPANMQQIEDRLHRIGQKLSVLVQILVIEGSIDSKMAKSVIKKMALIEKSLNRQSEKQSKEQGGQIKKEEPRKTGFTISQQRAIQQGLRTLAARTSGVDKNDSKGFDERDFSFGKSLASSNRLSEKQLPYGLKLIEKYRKQLDENLVKEAQGING